MEPQAAVAIPDEGGAMLVHSSTQCIDMIQTAVAAALNLPYNQVIARAPRAQPSNQSLGDVTPHIPATHPGHWPFGPVVRFSTLRTLAQKGGYAMQAFCQGTHACEVVAWECAHR